jgi:hypothetical protein
MRLRGRQFPGGLGNACDGSPGQSDNAPFMSPAAEFWADQPLWLLTPVFDTPCLRLEVLYLQPKVGHRLGGIRLIWRCQRAQKQSTSKPRRVLPPFYGRATTPSIRLSTALTGGMNGCHSQSCTLGNSSTSIGAGLSSMMISVTSLFCYIVLSAADALISLSSPKIVVSLGMSYGWSVD